MPHIVLLGDSVFDNAAYVAGGQEVVERLRLRLPASWRATLAARDGAVTGNVRQQLGRLPNDASHLIVSAGGNDALRNLGALGMKVGSVAEALTKLADIQELFRQQYGTMLEDVLRANLPTAICTIYEGRFTGPERRPANTGLAIFNDIITREAASRGIPLLDLRVLLSDDDDFANAIEPSAQGSKKLAKAILKLVSEHDFARGVSSIFGQTKA